jgi:hypothetical protein
MTGHLLGRSLDFARRTTGTSVIDSFVCPLDPQQNRLDCLDEVEKNQKWAVADPPNDK